MSNLSRLEALEIYVGRKRVDQTYVNSVFNYIIKRNVVFASLNALCINYPMFCDDWNALLVYIKVNANYLKCLDIACHGCVDSSDGLKEICNINNVTNLNLKRLSLKCDVLSCRGSTIHGWFTQMVQYQFGPSVVH